MKSHRMKPLQPAIVALAAALVIGSAVRSSAEDSRDSSSQTLQGTWWVHVTTFTDCVSRTPLISFSALLTFARGGTMTGTTTNPGFAIGQRSPDHGVWARKRAGLSTGSLARCDIFFLQRQDHYERTPLRQSVEFGNEYVDII